MKILYIEDNDDNVYMLKMRLELLDDSTRLAERAEAAGGDVTLEVWPEMIHVWHFFAAMLPEGQQAIDRIGEWVRQQLGVAVAAS